MRWSALLAIVALAAAGCGDDSPAGPAPRPNVVLVQTDDQDVASLAVMRRLRAAVARRGVTFSRYFATTPECCPSRATLLTGRYAHNHRVLANDPPRGGYRRLDGSETLAVWLDRAGYETAHVGRYLNHYGDPPPDGDPTEVPPGWDEWRAPVLRTTFRMYGYVLNEDGRLVRYGERPSDYATDVLAREALAFVRRAAPAELPFFLSVDTLAPHDETALEDAGLPRNPRPAPRDEGAFAGRPLPRPPSFDEADVSDKPSFVRGDPRLGRAEIAELRRLHRSRLESLLAVDRLVGRLVGALERAGELDRTFVVFTSDNGYMLGEHRQSGKFLPYEPSARVPLVISGPGIPQGEERRQLAANVDLAPTILELTGAEPGLELDGRSLVPALDDPRTRIHDAVLTEQFTLHPYAGVRTRRFAYTEYRGGEVELYDLARDPAELRNVAAGPSHAEVGARLARRLAALRDCSGDGCG